MLRIGDTITLETIDTLYSERYRCRLVETNQKKLYIDYPINEVTGKSTFFMRGTILKASFVGADNSVYSFNTEVIGRTMKEIPMVIIDFPSITGFTKIQRRQFVRIEVNVDVAVHSLLGKFSPFVTLSTDISAGGASIVIPKDVICQPGEELTTWFALPISGENHFLTLRSKLIRTIEGDGDTRRASIQFVGISNHEMQTITKFCFERQLSHRKKGLQESE
ncbi:flagellar brake protein [Litchfieldia alkalitelluris]|uniref:flagellar brake protein n=1 Tax=Litchfieldia alkalitelluris TaxID=304268 RepID=UPI0009988595|nr:flagellar brake domain-containing protein [Litchfieldia alkalitelluris]